MNKVKKQKFKKLTFKGYYTDLKKEPEAFITLIATECNVSRQTVYNWMNGKHEVPLLAQEKINQLTGKQLTYEQ